MTRERVTLKTGPDNWAELGCWIDGHWGQYGSDRLIQIAMAEGWQASTPQDGLLADIACTRLDDMGTRADLSDGLIARFLANYGGTGTSEGDVLGFIIELSDDCDRWLNDQLPEGYSFGWYDGEFFLQSDEWWEEGDG